ncbi:Ig-like domain-containing protein [Ramlibacter sp. PS3R-8]|uniref:Ig-like domain-containing protein n=1 Tax=Ramlibacter sp. PS3R-8 TaxID=3133437 RepID=UPI0030AECF4D
MNRYIKALGTLFLAGALAACGGGGGSSGNEQPTDPTDPVTPAVASIDVFTSGTELQSASNSSISFTVLPKDANNQAIPNQAVSFSATSGNLSGALPAPTTGDDAVPITGVTLSPGENRANRNITVTVIAGGASQQVVIPVVGTALTLSGDSFVVQGSTISYTVRAMDSADTPIPNAPLTVRSTRGNTVRPLSLTTNSQGVASFDFTGTQPGNDTIVVSGLGTSASANVSVSADAFQFLSPNANSNVNVNVNRTVTVQFLTNGNPVAGQAINFSTTRGTVTPASVATDANGQASATINSASAGPATIVAQSGSAQVTLSVNFLATAPRELELQASPSAVAPNSGGSTNNQSALSAIVRDSSGNAVANRVVSFTAESDPSGGTISPATAMTDSSGTATTQFIPGAGTTANNGVVIRATVQGTTVSGTASLTVNTQALFLALSTGNVITNVSGSQTTYEKEFAVQVTDSNGAAVASKSVTLAVVPQFYRKGSLAFQTGSWKYAPGVIQCDNEDTNLNGRLDAGEDRNSNGTLEPGGPVSLSRATVTTNASGMGTFTVQYGENYALWVGVQIVATSTVGGTESSATMNYLLLGMASDYNQATTAPAGVVSPFGTATVCRDPS